MHCILDLTALGYQCLRPVSDSAKYDVVVDLGYGNFKRIQCKSARWATDTSEEDVAFFIHTCCSTINTKEVVRHKYSKKDIDYFYTWFQGQGYLVSIEEASGLTFRWRYEYPASNQKKGVHIANDYKIEEVLKCCET